MRTNRFYLPVAISLGKLIISEERLVHQIKNVLRMHEGDTFSIFSGDGKEWSATIIAISKNECEVTISEEITQDLESNKKIHAGIAVLKKENFELVAQKLVEIGVASITPLISDRTIKISIVPERIEKIMIEAAEQSGRLFIPKLNEALSVKEFIETRKNVVIFHMESATISETTTENEIAFMVGPEGGWSREELAFFEEKKLPKIQLGKTVMRAETAAIIGAYKLVWN